MIKFMLSLCVVMSSLVVNAAGVCAPSDFCANKITALGEQLDMNCFSQYKESKDPIEMNDSIVALFDCMDNMTRNWSSGFGIDCGGKLAQDACFNKCYTYKSKIVTHCLSLCHKF